jgi:hypothetical protein
MNLNIDNMLNIGTVVQVKGSVKPVMIIGYMVVDDDGIHDYLGCLYPIGVLDSKHNLVFNSDDIKMVIENGYSDGTEIEIKKEHLNAFNEVFSKE